MLKLLTKNFLLNKSLSNKYLIFMDEPKLSMIKFSLLLNLFTNIT